MPETAVPSAVQSARGPAQEQQVAAKASVRHNGTGSSAAGPARATGLNWSARVFVVLFVVVAAPPKPKRQGWSNAPARQATTRSLAELHGNRRSKVRAGRPARHCGKPAARCLLSLWQVAPLASQSIPLGDTF